MPELLIQARFSHNMQIPSFNFFLFCSRMVEFGDSMNISLDLLCILPHVGGSQWPLLHRLCHGTRTISHWLPTPPPTPQALLPSSKVTSPEQRLGALLLGSHVLRQEACTILHYFRHRKKCEGQYFRFFGNENLLLTCCDIIYRHIAFRVHAAMEQVFSWQNPHGVRAQSLGPVSSVP